MVVICRSRGGKQMIDKPFLLHGDLVKQKNVQGAIIENGYMEIREVFETIQKNVTAEVVKEMEQKNEIATIEEETTEKKSWFKRWFK